MGQHHARAGIATQRSGTTRLKDDYHEKQTATPTGYAGQWTRPYIRPESAVDNPRLTIHPKSQPAECVETTVFSFFLLFLVLFLLLFLLFFFRQFAAHLSDTS